MQAKAGITRTIGFYPKGKIQALTPAILANIDKILQKMVGHDHYIHIYVILKALIPPVP